MAQVRNPQDDVNLCWTILVQRDMSVSEFHSTGGRLRTKARIRFKKRERVQRQAGERIRETISGDQRRILALSIQEYSADEIARELALPPEYVAHFMSGIVERLTHDGIIPSTDWRHVIEWAKEEGVLE